MLNTFLSLIMQCVNKRTFNRPKTGQTTDRVHIHKARNIDGDNTGVDLHVPVFVPSAARQT